MPTPRGDVAVSWALDEDRLALAVTLPANLEADVTVPTSRFGQPLITLNGRKVDPVVHITSGAYHFEVTGKLKPLPPAPAGQANGEKAADDLEADVVKDDLLHRCLGSVEDHCSHPGGGTNAGALFNGTTRNGAGESATDDDGQTFRGYGKGDWLTFHSSSLAT